MDYYNSPRWTYEFLDCSMPLTFDTYSICSYNCKYCFSYFQRALVAGAANYLSRNVKHVNVEKIKRVFLGESTTDWSWYVKDRYTMQWGGLSDQFDEYERQYGKTLELLKFFKELQYPISFSTKAAWFADDERYREVITGSDFWHFKVSIITLNQDRARAIEAGCPSPRERLGTIEKLANMGVAGVTLRLRPFIPKVSDRDYIALIRDAKQAGADSISTEYICVDTRIKPERRKCINDSVGYDLYAHYRDVSIHKSGYMRYSYALKQPVFERMQEECDKLGMRLHISDAHHKARGATGSCCGIADTGKCSHYFKGQFTNAIVLAKQKGYVSWDDMEAGGVAAYKNKSATDVKTFNPDRRARMREMTLYDFMKSIWNSPSTDRRSPYIYFHGVLVPDKVDEKGNVVYRFDYDRYNGKSKGQVEAPAGAEEDAEDATIPIGGGECDGCTKECPA